MTENTTKKDDRRPIQIGPELRRRMRAEQRRVEDLEDRKPSYPEMVERAWDAYEEKQRGERAAPLGTVTAAAARTSGGADVHQRLHGLLDEILSSRYHIFSKAIESNIEAFAQATRMTLTDAAAHLSIELGAEIGVMEATKVTAKAARAREKSTAPYPKERNVG